MRSTLYRWLVTLMLALLPLQSTAALTICPYSKSIAKAFATMSTMENCPFQQADLAADQADRSKNDAPADDQPQSCCASVSACALCGIAVSKAYGVGDTLAASQSSHFLSTPYASFIPDGLLRPPSFPA